MTTDRPTSDRARAAGARCVDSWPRRGLACLAPVLLGALLATPAFAGGEADTAADPGVVTIPMLFREGGNDANTVMNKEIIERFNAEYAGRYVLDIEWLPGMAEEYRQKLKVLNTANNLPAVVTNLAPEAAWAEGLMRNGRLMDLAPYFDADPDWQSRVFEESIELNTNADGRMYTTPATGSPYIGIFYNKEHFATAGIARFPTTWDQMWRAAERLEAAGITPFSMHTTETGWITNLMLTSYLAREQEGRDLMAITYPSDEFTSAHFIEGVEMLRRLYEYTTADAIGGKYALAANHFNSGDTAMIANGPWMIASFGDTQYAPEGFDEKVGYARFPHDIMISNLGREYGDGVSMDHELVVREGAVEWLRFNATRDVVVLKIVNLGQMTHKVTMTEEEKQQLGPVQREYANAVEGVKITIPWFQKQWDPITQNETVVNQLPAYLYNELTARQYAEAMRDSAKRYLASQQ